LNQAELLKLFPEAQINALSSLGAAYFSLPYQNKWVHIPHSVISLRERTLLEQVLSPSSQRPQAPAMNAWAHFLLEDATNIPAGIDHAQLLQFQIKFTTTDTTAFEQSLWLEAFRNTLPLIRDGFFLNEEYGVFILDNPTHFSFDEELTGILNTLDDDFSIRTSIYLGQSWPVDSHLPTLFKEERGIFLDSHISSGGKNVRNLAEMALSYYTAATTFDSPILQSLKTSIHSLEGSHDLIRAMWHNQGNVSKAATALYLHRNTLQYRIDRFFEATGLALKNMDDLLLCYLVIVAKINGTNIS
jgi:DNA-binding protein Fis